MEQTSLLKLFGFEVHTEPDWDVTSPVIEEPVAPRPILKTGNASKSAVRAVLKDAVFSTARDARRSSRNVPDVATHSRGLQLAVLGSDGGPINIDVEGRKVHFGEVTIHEFSYEKDGSPEKEQKIMKLRERFKGQDFSVVFHLLREEFERGFHVVILSTQGYGLVRQLIMKDGMIYLQRQIVGLWRNEMTCSCLSIKKFHFGRDGDAFTEGLSNWAPNTIPAYDRCAWIEMQGDASTPRKIYPLIFQTEGHRNSFIVFLRVMRRICAGSDLSVLDWPDAAGVDDGTLLSESGSEDDGDDDDDEVQSPRSLVDPREVALLSFKVKLSRGKPIRKVTRQGKIVNRTLVLMGTCLRLYSPTTKRGQVFGLEDDFVAINIGTDDQAFVALRESDGPLALEPEKSAVIVLTDHTCAVIFKDDAERDEIVYNLRYLVSKLHMAQSERTTSTAATLLKALPSLSGRTSPLNTGNI